MRVIFFMAAKNSVAPARVILFLDTSKCVSLVSWFKSQSMMVSAPALVILFLRRFRLTIWFLPFRNSHNSATCLSVSY